MPCTESGHGSSRCHTRLKAFTSSLVQSPVKPHSPKSSCSDSRWCSSILFHAMFGSSASARVNALYMFLHSCPNRAQCSDAMPDARSLTLDARDAIGEFSATCEAVSSAFVTVERQSTHVPKTSKSSTFGLDWRLMVAWKLFMEGLTQSLCRSDEIISPTLTPLVHVYPRRTVLTQKGLTTTCACPSTHPKAHNLIFTRDAAIGTISVNTPNIL